MTIDKRHLVRCAGCGYNFETELYGEISCPYCHSKIWLEAPEGYIPPDPVKPDDESQDDQDIADELSAELGVTFENQAQNDAPKGTASEDPREENQEESWTKNEAGQRMDDLRRLLESTLRARAENATRTPEWEQGRGRLLARFASTIKSVLSAPSRFFASLPDSGYVRAFVFGWIVCTLGVAFFCLYGLWQIDMNYQANLEMLKANGEFSKMGVSPEQVLDSIKEWLGISLVAAPLLGALNLLFSAIMNHLGLLLVAGRRMGFKFTLRATAYAFTPLLMLGVPVIGNLLGGVWSIVVQVIAIGQVHKLPTSRASLAVLLPLLGVLILLMAVLP